MSATATSEQLRVLRHMLGIDKHERCEPYRDRYCANAGDPKLEDMARAGLVELVARPSVLYPYDCYRTTPEGRALAIESQRAMIPNRKRERYQEFLRMKDVDENLTFRDFLKWEAEQKRAAP